MTAGRHHRHHPRHDLRGASPHRGTPQRPALPRRRRAVRTRRHSARRPTAVHDARRALQPLRRGPPVSARLVRIPATPEVRRRMVARSRHGEPARRAIAGTVTGRGGVRMGRTNGAPRGPRRERVRSDIARRIKRHRRPRGIPGGDARYASRGAEREPCAARVDRVRLGISCAPLSHAAHRLGHAANRRTSRQIVIESSLSVMCESRSRRAAFAL